MRNQLRSLIDAEDKRNPFTDEQLAEKLGTRRDVVTMLRSQLGIPDSRERRKPLLLEAVKHLTAQNREISLRDLTRVLNKEGFRCSKYVIAQLKQEIGATDGGVEKTAENSAEKKSREIKSEEIKGDVLTPFDSLIGCDGSLKPQIQQAKAAIMYPPSGLHTMVYGPTGTGKSILAEAMYEYGKKIGRLKPTAPLIVFNCADYAENPQLLLSQLFGHVKGAYTGAAGAKEGLVEKANGGILFLDEVHRLPPEGQELLFYLMDKGKYRRLGEETTRASNVMIIVATTEDAESSLLLTFRRRIPMLIELPPLASRPLYERNQLIREFFLNEAERVGTNIKLTREAFCALLLYDCPGNIGQLRSDIQVACARGFLNCVSCQKDTIEIAVDDLPVYVRRGLLRMEEKEGHPGVESLAAHDFIAKTVQNRMGDESKQYAIQPQEIYKYIEDKYKELEGQGLDREVINRFIGNEIEGKLQQIIHKFQLEKQSIAKKDLAGIVGREVIQLTEQMIDVAEKRTGKTQNQLFYLLAIHFSATLTRLEQGKPIINPQLERIKQKYKTEFKIAEEMMKAVEAVTGYTFPEDETAFIAMYLRTSLEAVDKPRGTIRIIVLAHGRVAGAIAELANRLMGTDYIVGIEMALDEKPETVLERTVEKVKEIDEGKGVLLLVDMGSLNSFGEIITQRTGISTRTVARVEIQMVLEAIRKTTLPHAKLDEIAGELGRDSIDKLRHFGPAAGGIRKKAILTVCFTGQGAALRVKKILERLIPGIGEKAEIIPVGVMGGTDMSACIEKYKREKNVVAIVGTIDPQDVSLAFYNVEDVLKGNGTDSLQRLLDTPAELSGSGPAKKARARVDDFMDDELIMIHPAFFTKSHAIDTLGGLLIREGYVEPEFLLEVYRREVMVPTFMENGIAIPHGNPEKVKKPGAAMAVLAEPLEWADGQEVDIIVMIALRKEDKSIVEEINRILMSTDLKERLKKVRTKAEVRKALAEMIDN